MERSIFMIGTALESRSGIAAVVNVYRANGLFRRAPVRYVPTHVDGAASAKLAVAARAGLRFLYEAARGRVALLHIHGSCGASFWRKALFAAAARALGVPYVFHLHGGRFPAFYARDCGALGRACVRAVLRAAEAVAVLSDEWRREVSAVEPAARVVVLPNPISVPRWRATLDGEVPTVLFLGVLREAKGVLELV
jgi:glycosyltransferase involved in cell wall biosynthesis